MPPAKESPAAEQGLKSVGRRITPNRRENATISASNLGPQGHDVGARSGIDRRPCSSLDPFTSGATGPTWKNHQAGFG